MQKYLALLVLVGISCVAAETPVYECDNGLPLPSSTQVNDCEELPCPLVQGSLVEALISFKSEVYTEVLRPETIAYALGVEVNYPLDEPDGCKALVDRFCPIDEGETVKYKLQMPVLDIFPKINLSLKFTMFDENDDGMVCFMLDAKVVGPSK
ncbi:NPC intracellular cholesterol transporter 2 [Onthophagus taurus]|uniref:NPC intracellular cholesterol transporter 2 n=1 Tax=Onthophagus taurus TaxID=166361 RepID=UPI000C20E03B|nr:epididymal secretory protein E1 [Onthophagus taurus]